MKANKKQLRQHMAEHLKSCSDTWFGGENQKITQRILNLEEYKQARSILAYLNMPKEVSLDDVIRHALAAGKRVYVPVCTEQKGIMIAVRLHSLEAVVCRGAYQIREPAEQTETAAEHELDLLLIPGVAFDRQGRRLGHGAGYYDRFLSSVSGGRYAAAAWDFQVVDTVPAEENDIPVDQIITERCVYKRHMR